MRPESEQHGLLDDVLTEAAPADFERALLDGMLRGVRRRRRMRQCSRGLAAVGILAAITLLVWSALLPNTSVNLLRSALHIVSSQPLPASIVIRTKSDSVVVVISSPTTFAVVETGAINEPFQEINDEQLLALAGGRPVALVRQGPHQAELLFLNPEDKNGFPVQ